MSFPTAKYEHPNGVDRCRYLFDVDGYQISHAPPGLDEVDPRLALTARASAERARSAAADGSTGLYSAYTGGSALLAVGLQLI